MVCMSINNGTFTFFIDFTLNTKLLFSEKCKFVLSWEMTWGHPPYPGSPEEYLENVVFPLVKSLAHFGYHVESFLI